MSAAARSVPGTGTLGVLELGTNSLKLHLCGDRFPPPEPQRVEWDVGFEVYSSRRISEETIEVTLPLIRATLSRERADPSRDPVFGIATGAFRDAENTEALLDRLYEELGVPVRVLSAQEEASLLIEGVEGLVPERPGAAFDLGGGCLEIVYLGAHGTWVREDPPLPLGVIRVHQLASLSSGAWDEHAASRWTGEWLGKALGFRLATIHGTGGTVKAIAQVAGAAAISLDEVRRIEDQARRDGPPPELSERRRELFLPGLLVVRRLMEHVGARTLHYTRVDLGVVLLGKLHPFRDALRGPVARNFLLHNLDIFRGAVLSPLAPPEGTV